ncbi:hypothetical protein K502DRAFT_135365 [Neoconidiobolus thromboides FSU 785]|nr:hypothetical protein K502DRAFT_135365 [Neoconidiobolus thromboides FSU 785]
MDKFENSVKIKYKVFHYTFFCLFAIWGFFLASSLSLSFKHYLSEKVTSKILTQKYIHI